MKTEDEAKISLTLPMTDQDGQLDHYPTVYGMGSQVFYAFCYHRSGFLLIFRIKLQLFIPFVEIILGIEIAKKVIFHLLHIY